MHAEQVFVNGQMYERNALPDISKLEDTTLLFLAFALNNDAVEDEARC
jgi:hypothetical protein